MAAAMSSSIILHGAGHAGGGGDSRLGSGILIKLSESVLQDLKRASKGTESLQFTTGSSPKLRIGSRTIDLSISADEFRNELFASTTASSASDLTFTTTIAHRARILPTQPLAMNTTAGTDAALEALQSSLASIEKERQAKQTTITNAILPTPKNRYDAARRERLEKKTSRPQSNLSSQSASPSLGVARPSKDAVGPTSAPASEENGKLQAMRTPVIHLLAMRPARREDIAKKTHIPSDMLDEILQKIGKQGSGEWQLSDRSYRELDVWKFGYTSKSERQAAIDNAVKAYDRLRLGKEEKTWQMLLPEEERGKGIILSKLQLGGGQQSNSSTAKGLTPHYQPSPTPLGDGTNDSRVTSAVNTPRLGASTPRPSSKGDVMKRLLSKDPKKARAVEDARERKRKEREAAASDREGAKEKKRKEREAAASDREGAPAAKRQATGKKANTKVKSEELVHSSDDEESDHHVRAGVNDNPSAAPPKTQAKVNVSTSSDSSDAPIKSRREADTSAAAGRAPNGKAGNTSTSKALAVKVSGPAQHTTPQKPKPTGLSAPSSQHKSQHSPQRPSSRPTVPSPLGAARPRVASDVSDRSAIGVQKSKQVKEAPKGLGITGEAFRHRHDTVTESSAPTPAERRRQINVDKEHKPAVNGVVVDNDDDMAKHRNRKAAAGAQRKAEDVSSSTPSKASKQQKVEPGAAEKAQSLKPDIAVTQASKGGASNRRTALYTPLADRDRLHHDTTITPKSSPIDDMTYTAAVQLCKDLWPTYERTYNLHVAKEQSPTKVDLADLEEAVALHDKLSHAKKHILHLERTDSENPAVERMSYHRAVIHGEKLYPIYAAAHDEHIAKEARGEPIAPADHDRLMALYREYAQTKRHCANLMTKPDPDHAAAAAEVEANITFNQGVGLADKFVEVYLPAYTRMYDELEAKMEKGEGVEEEERERLWTMHRRLEQMQREIQIASEREGKD